MTTTLPIVNPNTYYSLEKMLCRLKMTESWRGKIPTQEGFSKEDKEALNVIIFACIKEIMLSRDADLTGIPAYILKRLYKKAYTWDAKPVNTKFFRETIPEFDLKLETYVQSRMGEQGAREFAEFIRNEAAKLSPEVLRVYKAARVLGTLIEFEEMSEELRADTAEETRQQVYKDLYQFADLPHFMDIAQGIGEYRELKTLLKAISCSRYTFRWQGYIAPVRCSILAHMLESAIIGYLMNLEEGRETDLVHDFWVLMFHDLPEIWTDDIPSPVKDGVELSNPDYYLMERVGKVKMTLRDISELQELEALEENFYARLPDEIAEFFRDGVMLEDVDEPEVKCFYKAADYFSADLEVYWNIKGGSREADFKKILKKSLTSRRTAGQKALLEKFLAQLENVTFFD